MGQAVTGSVVTAVGLSALLMSCGTTSPPTSAPPTSAPPPTAAVAVEPLSIGTAAEDTTGGLVADGQLISPFDVENPAVGFLEPALLAAIQNAATAASADGVDVKLTSGWRSTGFQKRLFDQAVTTYGSADLAAQFVASPEKSMHVVGKAVDVGPVVADQWMIANGSRFGLCQIYANEIWHFELAVDAAGICPPLRPNAAG
ncbi:M15 family metallopeptidase [Mycobacterium yunnanensis]|uniref:M15 family metallopeptidase n=1 Tax=Mycobacterium yunnanensis TaxID=368477 RepID=A0A9X3C1G2_9MYCO|nr:M15 family metallopeptidase [Mycobacterium yunnanensis]MCV7420231.1 M15 family metallopeptidase [Mycobacterium yunnanensis]